MEITTRKRLSLKPVKEKARSNAWQQGKKSRFVSVSDAGK